jgi:uncharacterized protein YegL
LATIATTLSAAETHVVVVLDDSGSMESSMRGGQQKMQVAKQALQTVLEDLPDDAKVGVLALNSKVGGNPWIVPLGPVDRTGLQRQISRINAAGSTPLGAAMKQAADALLTEREKNVYGTYRLLIVTDGEATDENLVERYLPKIKSRGLVTDVIGVAMSEDHSLATKVNTYRRGDDPQSLTQAIAEVFAETSDDDLTTGQSDYELLAGLPNEVAAAAVYSLSQIDNQPISESAADESAVADMPSRATTPVPAGSTTVDDRRGSGLGLVCFGAFFLFLVIVGLLAIAGKSQSR